MLRPLYQILVIRETRFITTQVINAGVSRFMRVRRFSCPVADYKTLSEIIIVLDRKYSNPRHSLWRNSLTASGEFMGHWLIAEFTPSFSVEL